MPCNCEVNLITRLGVIALFTLLFFLFKHFCLIFQKLLEIKVKFKLQKCAAYQDLPPLHFLAHLAKGYVSFYHHLASVVVNFNLLLRNHWANCSQTLVERYLYGPLPKLCPLILISNHDGRQAKNR